MPLRRSSLVLVLVCAAVVSGCNTARGVVANVKHSERMAVVNGQPDWGSDVAFDLTNSGKRGALKIKVTLSTSEGQWERSQELLFESGETRHLTYFFQEPSINATNFQPRVQVEP